MKTINDLLNQYYEEFKGLPSNKPIIRNNQLNDAFEMVVLKILYGKELPTFSKENISTFCDYIVAPPDNGIDIFFQRENGDEYSFDVIQVKFSELDENSLRTAMLGMQRTIEDYCKNPSSIKSDSCREVLSRSALDKSNKNRCDYYVVHTGTVDDFSGSNDNEKVITKKALEILLSNKSEEFVDQDSLSIDTNMCYGSLAENNGAIVCSLNGFDLARLSNTYFSTEAGRNLLFGSNLRESLITPKSKPYLSMSDTIIKCPENFWYYNNGITIIAKDISFDKTNPNRINLNGFSIVNGAQTTSCLGLFLKEAKKNHEDGKVEQLKKVHILTRVLKISDEKMRQSIAIFNNTQTPITTRDMVANRPEQIHLNQWLMDDTYPQIYVEIRRGAHTPSNFNKGISHRITKNEELAQLAYAGFLQKPYTAKDKKSALFNNDYTQSEYIINPIYHEIFSYDAEKPENCGVVFQKTKVEIDELLFIQQLYKETKKIFKATYVDRISKLQEKKQTETNAEQIKSIDARIAQQSLHLDTTGICMFYFISLYYEFKAQFDKKSDTRIFDYDRYYSDKVFKKSLIEDAANLFLQLTVKVLVSTATKASKTANMNNWVRASSCEAKFFDELREQMASDLELETKYENFLEKYKK